MKHAIEKIVVLAAVLFVIPSFVQKLTEAEAQEKKTVQVVFVSHTWTSSLPFRIAIAKGYFKSQDSRWSRSSFAVRFLYSFVANAGNEGLFYNAELAKPEELRSFDDLLNPKWKGKIGLNDPRIGGSGTLYGLSCGRSKAKNI